MLETLKFYKFMHRSNSFSSYKRQNYTIEADEKSKRLVDMLAYCLMPNHIHLAVKQLCNDGITLFIGRTLNSYTKYFNLRYDRKGPMWDYRFNNILIESDEQLLHTIRYIHLNPTTGFLVNDPFQWKFSSYQEYVGIMEGKERLCESCITLNMSPDAYKDFCLSNIELQRQITVSKNLGGVNQPRGLPRG